MEILGIGASGLRDEGAQLLPVKVFLDLLDFGINQPWGVFGAFKHPAFGYAGQGAAKLRHGFGIAYDDLDDGGLAVIRGHPRVAENHIGSLGLGPFLFVPLQTGRNDGRPQRVVVSSLTR